MAHIGASMLEIFMAPWHWQEPLVRSQSLSGWSKGVSKYQKIGSKTNFLVLQVLLVVLVHCSSWFQEVFIPGPSFCVRSFWLLRILGCASSTVQKKNCYFCFFAYVCFVCGLQSFAFGLLLWHLVQVMCAANILYLKVLHSCISESCFFRIAYLCLALRLFDSALLILHFEVFCSWAFLCFLHVASLIRYCHDWRAFHWFTAFVLWLGCVLYLMRLVVRHNSLNRCCICNVAVLKAFHVRVYVCVLCMMFWTFCFALHKGLQICAR